MTIRRYVKSDAFLTGAIATIVFGRDGNKSSFNSAYAPIYFAFLGYYLISHLVYELYNTRIRQYIDYKWSCQMEITQIFVYLQETENTPLSAINVNPFIKDLEKNLENIL